METKKDKSARLYTSMVERLADRGIDGPVARSLVKSISEAASEHSMGERFLGTKHVELTSKEDIEAAMRGEKTAEEIAEAKTLAKLEHMAEDLSGEGIGPTIIKEFKSVPMVTTDSSYEPGGSYGGSGAWAGSEWGEDDMFSRKMEHSKADGDMFIPPLKESERHMTRSEWETMTKALGEGTLKTRSTMDEFRAVHAEAMKSKGKSYPFFGTVPTKSMRMVNIGKMSLCGEETKRHVVSDSPLTWQETPMGLYLPVSQSKIADFHMDQWWRHNKAWVDARVGSYLLNAARTLKAENDEKFARVQAEAEKRADEVIMESEARLKKKTEESLAAMDAILEKKVNEAMAEILAMLSRQRRNESDW